MAATVDCRYARAGFVYTKRTQMLFAPLFTATRDPGDADRPDIVIGAAHDWPQPNKGDLSSVIAALIGLFPDASIYCENAYGVVPLYHAKAAA